MIYRKEVLFSDINIPVDEIYSSMGFKNTAPDDETRRMTETLLAEAPKYLNLQYEFVVLDGELTDNSCTLYSDADNKQLFETGRVNKPPIIKNNALFTSSFVKCNFW